MDEPFYLGAYWGPRRESAEDCARRLSDCMLRLGACSELLGPWYEKADRKADAQRHLIAPDAGILRELMLAGANRREVDGSAIEELGFSLGLWNGDFEKSAGLSAGCGSWTSVPSLMNAFSLNLPPAMPGPAGQLYEPDTALAMMQAAVEAWEPDWATLTSHSLADALDPGPRKPIVGWITYLSEQRAIPKDIPVAVRKRLPDMGALLVAVESADEVDAPRLREIAGALDAAGVLFPTHER